ncbi:MAG: insulinase family protein [Oligoflexia bacterium]|nr:insulinase family protein [Oligoflexia bacterium]
MNVINQEEIEFLGEKTIQKVIFDNGLKLAFVKNPIAPVFSYQTWYDVGSRDEEQGKSGLAHLFEHMMFKGTVKNPQGHFDRKMESAGARDLNAFTSTDYTAYVASLPSEKLDMVAELESDRMIGLNINESQFTSEREVVRNERKQRTDNNPEGVMFEELQKNSFKVHSYGRPVIGFEEDLDRMSVEDCKIFYRRNYAPNNAIICISGDLDLSNIITSLQKHYGGLARGPARVIDTIDEPEQNEERRKELKLSLKIPKVYIAYKIPPATHEDQLAISMLASILSSGRSSRLYRNLVDSSLCLDSGCSPHPSKDASLFYFSFTCQIGTSYEKALNEMDLVISKICNDGVEDIELERAKNKIRTEIYMGLNSNSSMAHFMGQNEIVLGDLRNGVKDLTRILNVNKNMVRDVAQKYLVKNRRSMIVGIPK